MDKESQTPEVREDSEPFGTLPNGSETFGTIRNNAEPFGSIPKPSERKEYCTLTVREVARMFEAAGVVRTERSIINWCQPNKIGVCRLENYFDPNERKYFISPKSVDQVVQEEIANAAEGRDFSAGHESFPKGSETEKPRVAATSEVDPARVSELEREILDLKITNRGKDYLIAQLRNERQTTMEQLMTFSRKVGELETKLLQLQEPHGEGNG